MNARSKGRRGEREVIEVIKTLTDTQLEVNYSQTYGGGHDLLGAEPYAIEVKRRRCCVRWWTGSSEFTKKKILCIEPVVVGASSGPRARNHFKIRFGLC